MHCCVTVCSVAPENFPVSILVPIPKGPRVDARNSDNYCAVALSNVLGKILDIIMVCNIDLFNVLSKRSMCALVRRLLMTMYSDQRIQVRWSNILSEMTI